MLNSSKGLSPEKRDKHEWDRIYVSSLFTFNITPVAYATRGCICKGKFCAVRKVQPEFKHYLPIAQHIEDISGRYGAKKDLILPDNAEELRSA